MPMHDDATMIEFAIEKLIPHPEQIADLLGLYGKVGIDPGMDKNKVTKPVEAAQFAKKSVVRFGQKTG